MAGKEIKEIIKARARVVQDAKVDASSSSSPTIDNTGAISQPQPVAGDQAQTGTGGPAQPQTPGSSTTQPPLPNQSSPDNSPSYQPGLQQPSAAQETPQPEEQPPAEEKNNDNPDLDELKKQEAERQKTENPEEDNLDPNRKPVEDNSEMGDTAKPEGKAPSPKSEPPSPAGGANAGKAANAGKEAEQAVETARKAKQVADAAKATQATTQATAASGGTCWIAALVIVGIILLLVIIFSVIMCLQANRGDFGSATPIPAGKDSTEVKDILGANTEKAKSASGQEIVGFTKLILNDEDKKYVEDGNIDKRLAEILKYLSDKHLSLNISHIVSGYSKTAEENTEGGLGRDSQVIANVSAHAKGTAADISKIDFIYKVDEEKESCKALLSGICGPAAAACKHVADQVKLGDLVYYSDQADDSTSEEELDTDALSANIDLQKIVMEEAQTAIENNKQQIDELTAEIEATKKVLEEKQTNPSLTTEQRAKLQTQIDRVNVLLEQAKLVKDKVNALNEKIKAFNTTISDLQKNLLQLKENLQKIKDLASKTGASGEVNDIIKKMNTTVNKIGKTLDSVAKQTTNLATIVADVSAKITTNTQNLSAVVKDSSEDMNAYLDSVDQTTAGMAPNPSTDALDDIEQSLPNFENFTNLVKNLAEQTANAAIDRIKKELEEQLQKSVEEELNKALGSLGLGFLGDTALLRLPCMGFVPPGTTGASDKGNLNDLGISDIKNLNLEGAFKIGFKSFNTMEIIKKFIPEELLAYAVVPNTEYKGNKNAQAIPIKIKWQDDKPDVVHVSPEQDDTSFMNPLIYYTVYRPEARRKTNQIIEEMLQFPYDKNSLYYYRVNQLITFSHERDVKPFWEKLKAMYGWPRTSNKGLFAMPESWAQVHIGY